jgi:4-amino-4-deoxy-L-arabinose transferase-like glycosyltransferase
MSGWDRLVRHRNDKMSQDSIKPSSRFYSSRWVHWVVGALALLCFTLGVWRNDAKSMWWDESLSLQRAQSTVTQIITNQLMSSGGATTDQHPPFYFLLLRGLILLAGESDTVLRFPSALFSCLLVPLLYVMGCRLRNYRTGLLAAGLGALSPFLLWYAQEVRMYTLVTFLGLLSTFLLWQTIAKRKWYFGIGYSCAVCLGLLTNYLFTLLLPVQFLFALLVWPQHKAIGPSLRWRRWIGLAALVIPVLVLPILVVFVVPLIPELSSNRIYVPPWMIVRDVFNSFSLGLSVNYFSIWPIDIVFVICYIIGIISVLWRPIPSTITVLEETNYKITIFTLLFGYVFIPIILIWLFSYIAPLYMGSRYLIMSVPGFILCVALGLDLIASWRSLPAWIMGIFLVGSMSYSIIRYQTAAEYSNKEDYRAAARTIASNESSGDVILVKWAEALLVFRHYYEGHLQVISYKDLGDQWGVNPNAVQQFTQRYDRIWLVEGNEQNYNPMQRVSNELMSNTLLLSKITYSGYVYPVTLTSYFPRSPSVQLSAQGLAPQGVFGRQIELIDYSLRYFDDKGNPCKVPANEIRTGNGMTNSVPSGNTIGVYLTMHVLQTIPDCKTSLRILDDQGRLIAQRDDVPLMYLPSSQWTVESGIQFQTNVRIPLGTPPGLYHLVLLFYRQADGQAFSYQQSPNTLEAPWFEISTIRVSEGQPYSYELNSLPDGQALLSLPPRFGPLRLLGYTLPKELNVGSSTVILLYWRVLGAIAPDLELVINWRDSTGRIWLTTYLDPASSGDNQTSWPVGALRRCLYTLDIPADAPHGTSDLYLLVRLRNTNRYYGIWRGILPLLRHTFRLGAVQIG